MLRAAGAFGRGPGVIGRLINDCGTFPGKNALNSALLSFRGPVPTRNSSGGGGTLRIKQTAFHNEKLYDEMAELVETPEDYEPSIEDRWFQESELAKQDYRGWQFIPVNPAGVLRAHKDELLHEEMGHWFPR
ncbi:unnamed protein product [Schistocephalus solidus]|uniref:39S ribosomal protein L46, mitochondrial n=1 Tax=Schistocephalus solidus TaxID=70667 RepID=A0A183S7S8_SCHSO|nr:unnamed protein product [Schistocephalus solidus]